VKLLGFQANPYSVMAQSDGFILSSRHEGFPNVLLEANALGIPVFSNRCPGGINEIVVDGVNGLTCDMQNQDDFNKTFVEFMTMSFDSHKIVKSVETRYSFEVILPQYDNVFKRLLKI
jgi:glycosyltransferase involved in cell wall biosynthesis